MALAQAAPARSSAASARSRTGRRGRPIAEGESQSNRAFLTRLKRLGSVAPQSAKEMGKLQQQLVDRRLPQSRGAAHLLRHPARPARCSLFALLATPILMQPNFAMALGACGVGYLLPSMALGRLAKRRQHRIRLGLPDALDLLVVSVEAGLGLDQAIQRVGDELAFAHPAILRTSCG